MMALLLLGLLFSSQSYAFTLAGSPEAKFDDPKVYIDISSNSCSAIGLNSEELLDFIEEAVDQYWNQVPTCALELVRGERVNIDIASVDTSDEVQLTSLFNTMRDNRILVGCNQGSFTGAANNVLGVGLHGNNRGLVLMNASAGNEFQEETREQQKAVLAHEIGHAFFWGTLPIKSL